MNQIVDPSTQIAQQPRGIRSCANRDGDPVSLQQPPPAAAAAPNQPQGAPVSAPPSQVGGWRNYLANAQAQASPAPPSAQPAQGAPPAGGQPQPDPASSGSPSQGRGQAAQPTAAPPASGGDRPLPSNSGGWRGFLKKMGQPIAGTPMWRAEQEVAIQKQRSQEGAEQFARDFTEHMQAKGAKIVQHGAVNDVNPDGSKLSPPG